MCSHAYAKPHAEIAETPCWLQPLLYAIPGSVWPAFSTSLEGSIIEMKTTLALQNTNVSLKA